MVTTGLVGALRQCSQGYRGQLVGAVGAVGPDAAEQKVLAKVVDGVGGVGGIAKALAMAGCPALGAVVDNFLNLVFCPVDVVLMAHALSQKKFSRQI